MNRYPVLGLLLVLSGGCVSIPPDRGRSVSESLVSSHSDIASVSLLPSGENARMIDELVAKPVTANTAVQIALLNNPRMKELYAELGLVQADVYDASRLSNPSLGFAQLSAQGVVTKTTLSISQRFAELLFLNFNSRMTHSEVMQAQQRVAHEVLTLESDVRGAYYDYVTAQLVARMRAQAALTALTGSKYAEQLHAAGNISQLQLSREQIAASESLVEQHKAQAQAGNKYSVLLNLLGLQRGALQIDERLAIPVDQQLDASVLQDWTLKQRLDISALREQLKSTQQQLNHVRHWRWLTVAEAGVEREHDRGDAAATGPAASIELPLFNQGDGTVMRKRARVEMLAANLASAELSARNNIVAQLATLTSAKQVVDQYQHSLVPLHDQVITLTQQRFNYMLIGAPELLLAKQQALNAREGYLRSVCDYWLAYVALQRIAGGKLPGDSVASDAFIGLDTDDADSDSATPVMHH